MREDGVSFSSGFTPEPDFDYYFRFGNCPTTNESKVSAMAKQEAEKAKSGGAESKPKAPKAKPEADAAVKDKAKAKDAGKEKAAPEAEKAPAPPRPPADPRLKVFKKFHGKFLPKGPLRDRHTALMKRWNSDEAHGGVTVEELKSLLEDWRKSREKPVRAGK